MEKLGILSGAEVTGEPLFTEERSYWKMKAKKVYAGVLQGDGEFYLQLATGEVPKRKNTYLLRGEPHGGAPFSYHGLPVYGMIPSLSPLEEGPDGINEYLFKGKQEKISQKAMVKVFKERIRTSKD